jgi:hypothetical protein
VQLGDQRRFLEGRKTIPKAEVEMRHAEVISGKDVSLQAMGAKSYEQE